MTDAPNESDVARWLSYAIFHSQVGSTASARYRFDMANRWFEKNAPQNEKLLRLRDQAAKSLGLPRSATSSRDSVSE